MVKAISINGSRMKAFLTNENLAKFWQQMCTFEFIIGWFYKQVKSDYGGNISFAKELFLILCI